MNENETCKADSDKAQENITDSHSVEKLKTLLSEKYKNLRLPPDGNNILERCLRRRNFNLVEAANQVDLFFRLFEELSKINKDNLFTPSAHKTYFFDSFGFVVLKQRDLSGRRVIWFDYEALPAETYSLDNGLAATILMMNELTRVSVDDQNDGVVYVFNLKAMSFGHVKQFSLSRIKTIVKLMQGAIPLRIKAYHVMHSPGIFSYTYSLLRPLLKSKIKDRIKFHGNDLTDFYKEFGRNAIPDCLEGDQPIEECVDTEFMDKMCAGDSYYKELLRFGYSTLDDKAND